MNLLGARHSSGASSLKEERATGVARPRRMILNFREWQLALPLALAFTAVFVAPLLLLIGVSFFDDDKISQPGLASWVKFFADPFNYKVIADTLLLGAKTVCTTVLIGYPLALVYLELPDRPQ